MSTTTLHYLMAAQRINQTDLSKKTGVPQPTISRMLNGDTRSPRLSSVSKLAKHFGITLDEFVGGML
jgi:transcriptional regulator with XRE-family HTH domain